jgi:hypothetical protein
MRRPRPTGGLLCYGEKKSLLHDMRFCCVVELSLGSLIPYGEIPYGAGEEMLRKPFGLEGGGWGCEVREIRGSLHNEGDTR